MSDSVLFEGAVKWSKQSPSDDGKIDHRAKVILGHPNAGQIAAFLERWEDSGGKFEIAMKAAKEDEPFPLEAEVLKSEQKPGDEGRPGLLVTLNFGVLEREELEDFFRPWYAGDDETIYFSFTPVQHELDLEAEPDFEGSPEPAGAAA